MSERIGAILDVISDVAKRYTSGMSQEQITSLRIEALEHVAKHRSIQTTTVSSKFRRELQPDIKGTKEFDQALYMYLDSGDVALRSALEQNATAYDLAKISDVFDANDGLMKQVADDLESLQEEESGFEGGGKIRLISHFERNPTLRAAAIKIHGTSCIACGFDFEAKYGLHGRNYIEVHHLVPISTLAEPATIDVRHELTVLCSNCHRMVHRIRDFPLSLDELVEIIAAHRLG